MAINGGCLCGAVRYTTDVEPVLSAVCHCRDCQKFTGAAFAALVPLQKSALSITGPIKTHSAVGGSGKPVIRNFCGECGSSLFEEPTVRPGLAIIFAGTLDDPKAGAPERIAAVDAVRMLFEHDDTTNVFLPRYRPLLQDNPAILHEHGRVAGCLKQLKGGAAS